MTKCAAYLRVSTTEQSVDNQLPGIQRHADLQGWQITEVYAEEASAWRNGHQKELARLRNELRTGKRKFSHVLVWSLDRLSREGPLEVLKLLDSFKRLDCPVVSVKEPWSDTPFSDVMYSLIAWVAKYESDRRSDRTLAGLERAKAEGKKLGRPKGSKDKGKRRRTGYLLRYANK